MDFYSPQGSTIPLSQLIPPSHTVDSFSSELTAKFTQVRMNAEMTVHSLHVEQRGFIVHILCHSLQLVYQTLGTTTELSKQNLLQL